jgi:ActR/RegA family two-component response regulator
MPANRVLFVDDEYSLRITVPQILRMHGFEVCVAATVAQALAEITTNPYDILVSDLNIGEAGDGFTVVSAMRRTQPDCINIILTGFPAFESALAAIQGQVDDYLIKPARAGHLVDLIRERMRDRNPRNPRNPVQPMRLSKLLRQAVHEIRENTLAEMKSDSALSSIAMSDEQRVGYLAGIVIEIANQMNSPEPDELANLAIEASREHGLQRLSAGYTITMLMTDSAILNGVVFDMVRERLLSLDTSNLVLDLKRFTLGLQVHTAQSVQAFCDEAGRPCSMELRAG